MRTYFPHWEKASRRIRGFDIWANPLVEIAHWIGVASAAVGRHINWRGIRYHVVPGGQVQEIIRDDYAEPQPVPEELLVPRGRANTALSPLSLWERGRG